MRPALTAPTASNTVIRSILGPGRAGMIARQHGAAADKNGRQIERAAAISMPGTILSQLGIITMASRPWAMAMISTESAISSRLASEYFIPS
jgi:hypothetical protein